MVPAGGAGSMSFRIDSQSDSQAGGEARHRVDVHGPEPVAWHTETLASGHRRTTKIELGNRRSNPELRGRRLAGSAARNPPDRSAAGQPARARVVDRAAPAVALAAGLTPGAGPWAPAPGRGSCAGPTVAGHFPATRTPRDGPRLTRARAGWTVRGTSAHRRAALPSTSARQCRHPARAQEAL